MKQEAETSVPFWERTIAVAALLLLSPLLLLLMGWVKIVSPGPAVFISERIGKDGRIFRLFKLRTMIPDAPMVVSPEFQTFVAKDDVRLISGGTVLRKGFDELFQFLNIARGEMRFVGPRPDPVWMKKNYLPEAMPRFSVYPGITGWAQILGSRDTTTRQGLLFDLWYVRKRNWRLDLRIAVWTPLYILFGMALPARDRERCLAEMSDVGMLFQGEEKSGSTGERSLKSL